MPFTGDSLPQSADVVIVGGGYSGLWTAIHLKNAQPALSVVVLEAREPGFGASGRNGGWCSALFPVDLDHLASLHGADLARRQQTAMNQTVTDIETFVTINRIDCDWARSGTLTVATNPAHRDRLTAQANLASRHGFTDTVLIEADACDRLVRVDGAIEGLFNPHCAALHPMKLLNGLVRVAREAGVTIVGEATVTHVEQGKVCLADGHVTSTDWIVLATEGYSPAMRGRRREVLPMWSYMIATEPLSDSMWHELGWDSRVTVADGRNMVTYAQRTADGRIAFGGRGIGYRFGSRSVHDIHQVLPVHRHIEETMHQMFPITRTARVTHRWGGPIAVPRDWHPSVQFDHQRRYITLGGYSGDGVAASHLAGRTAAALVTGSDDPVTSLPWVNHRSPTWEIEPLRWLGVNALSRLPELADRIERRAKRPARRINTLFDRLS